MTINLAVCVYMCVRMYVHVYMHIYIYVFLCVREYVYILHMVVNRDIPKRGPRFPGLHLMEESETQLRVRVDPDISRSRQSQL